MADACWGLSQWFVCPAEWVCCLSLKQPSREKHRVSYPRRVESRVTGLVCRYLKCVSHEPLCGCAEFSFPPARSVCLWIPPCCISTFNSRYLIDALMQSNSLKWNSKTEMLNKSPSKQLTGQGEQKQNNMLSFSFFVVASLVQRLGSKLCDSLLLQQTKCVSQQDYVCNINVDVRNCLYIP